MQGLVVSGSNNVFKVACEDGVERLCTIKGKVLEQETKYHNPLAPGDFVQLEPASHDEAQILTLMPRKNFFARFNEKTASPQILAANVDLVLCMTTPDTPPFRPVFVDRILVQAASQHIPVAIVLNKIDLTLTEKVRAHISEWRRLHYPVYQISARSGEGIPELIKIFTGKTVCIIGQSGVGKSSLLNDLAPALQVMTGKVSEKYNKGSHTTTRGALYRITTAASEETVSFNIIDTPGIKNFSLCGIAKDEVACYFPEMVTALGKCKFGLSCSHKSEPGCEVLRRIQSGEISPLRYESWLNMTE